MTERFFRQLENVDEISDRGLIGLIVFSAMRFGGLCERKAVHALLSSIRSEWYECGQQLCVDLRVDEWEVAPQILHHNRRFMSDAITEVLLRYWYRKSSDAMLLAVDRDVSFTEQVETILRESGIMTDVKRSTFKSMLSMCEAGLMLEGLSGSELAYCTGTVPSYSVSRTHFLRLVTGRSSAQSSNVRDRKPALVLTAIGNTTNCQYLRFQEFLQRMRKQAKDERIMTRQQCRNYVSEVIEALPSKITLERLLYEWTLYLLDSKHYRRYKLKLSTIEKYASIMANLLSSEHHQDDSINLETVMVSLYNQLLRMTTQKRQGYVSVRILQFDAWLVEQYDYDGVDTTYVENLKLDKPWVRANFISSLEYRRAKLSLLPDGCDSLRGEKIQALILILCYRLGLRSSEALGLKLNDCHLQGMGDVIIRFHQGEGKTPHAVRRLPLAFLSDDELTLLRQWFSMRKNEVKNGKNAWLFISHRNDDRLVTSTRSIDVVRRVLKKVTGDPCATVHWLRHSFANCMVLLEVQRTHGLMLNEYGGITHCWYDYNHANRIHEAFSKHSNEKDKNLRNSFWMALCTFIGHSSPVMTRRYYVHVMDIVLSNRFKEVVRNLSIKATCSLLSIKKSACYNAFSVAKGGIRIGEVLDRLRHDIPIQSLSAL